MHSAAARPLVAALACGAVADQVVAGLPVEVAAVLPGAADLLQGGVQPPTPLTLRVGGCRAGALTTVVATV